MEGWEGRERNVDREIAREFGFEHWYYWPGITGDVYSIIIGRTVRYGFPSPPMQMSRFARTFWEALERGRVILVALRVRYKRGARYLLRVVGFWDFWLRNYLDLVACGVSFRSIVGDFHFLPSLKPGLYIETFLQRNCLNIKL